MLDRTPQVFISYSWTSKEYQESIVSLASRMRHDGVDVKIDVWDLKEGQDKYVYMEQCVTNPRWQCHLARCSIDVRTNGNDE